MKRGTTGWWIAALTAVLLGAIATRAFVQFHGAVPPAMDPAYYPVQAWWLFNEGRLLYQDAPLIFVVDGISAKALMLTGMPEDRAYLAAAQAVDCVTEPWVALFVFLFGFAWCGGARRGIPVVLAGAVLAVLSAPVIRMVSDFEKNSLGLVWATMTWWALWRAMRAHDAGSADAAPAAGAARPAAGSRRWFAVAAAALGLAALTHGGSFGCAAFGAAAITATWLLAGIIPRRTLAVGAASVALAGAIALALLYSVSPGRARALLEAPQKIFGQGDSMRWGDLPRDRPGGFGAAERSPPDTPTGARLHSGIDVRDDRGRSPQRFGPPGMDPPDRPGMGPPGGRDSHGTVIGLAVGVCGIAVIAFRWRREAGADRAVVIGLSALCMLLVCPFLNPEYAQRLNLMAAVPVGVVFSFLGCRLAAAPPPRAAAPLLPPGAPLYRAAAAWLIAIAVGHGAIHSIAGISTPEPVITEAQLQELFAMRGQIPAPRTTLIIAEHGIEWWAGYALHTPVRMDRIPDGAAEKYSRILFLKNKLDHRRPPPGGPGGDAPNTPGDKPFRGPPEGPGGPHGDTLDIPANARRVYQGESFELIEADLPSKGAG